MIENQNEVPILSKSNESIISHPENGGKIVANLNVTDPDENQPSVKYKINKGDDGNHFKITRSGDLAFLRLPDYENPIDENKDNLYKVSLSNGNPEHLDWIYIDGDHSYEVCLRDLENSLDVVKKDGIILGDDYYWPNAKWGKKGVTKAVNEFIEKHNFKMFKHGETQYEIRL